MPSTRTRRGSSPDCATKPKILSEITGSTHGITFKIKPPRNAYARNIQSGLDARDSGLETGAAIEGRDDIHGTLISYPARSLPDCWTTTPEISVGQSPSNFFTCLR